MSCDRYSCVQRNQHLLWCGMRATAVALSFAILSLGDGSSTLAVGTAAISGTTATMPLSFVSGTGNTAGLEWTVNVPGATAVQVQAGPAATGAGKALYCNGATCLLTGMNADSIPNGVVATLSITLPATAGSLPVQLTNVSEALGDGTAGTISVTGGSITLGSSSGSSSDDPPPPGAGAGDPPPSATGTSVSSIQCADAAVFSNSNTTCTVAIAAASSTDTSVALSVQGSTLSVPVSASIPAGDTTATFVADSGTTSTLQTDIVTASTNGGSSTAFAVAVMPAPVLLIQGNQAEVNGTSNGSVVTPAIGPSGFTGAVVALGGGSVNFSPIEGSDGVYFLNCCKNDGNAYYKFNGAAVGNVFNSNQGQISFYLKSRYSFAGRIANAPDPRYAFDVRDGNDNHLFYFYTQVAAHPNQSLLEFYYLAAGSGGYYFVPVGTEDQLFGQGVILKVKITWNQSVSSLFLNDTLVKSIPFTATASNWNSDSNFDLGAYEYHNYGGYNVSDDVVSDFTVATTVPETNSASTSNPALPPVISAVNAAPESPSSETITWTTDQGSTSQTAYGTTAAYGSLSPLNSGFATTHTLTLTGLMPATTYHYEVESADTDGNLATSPDFAFTTASAPVGPQVLFQLNGAASEVSGTTNGSIVTPITAPVGFKGTVIVNGTGSVDFSPAQLSDGVYFSSCCTNQNNAYYNFVGVAVGNIFGASSGRISFDLTSRYNFTQRQTSAASPRFAFDVRDGSGKHLFYFLTQSGTNGEGPYLAFDYLAAGAGCYYFVPLGTEDQLFGQGVTMKVTITWDGSTADLYLNDKLVKSTAYSQPAFDWSAASVFDLGAYEYQSVGGYNSSDDIISGFTVTTLGQ